MSASTNGLLEALLAFQSEAPKLPKDGSNPHFRSRFTTLDTIVETVGPLLNKHGLVWTTLPGRDSTGEPALHYRLAHAATGESLDGCIPLLLTKADPQGQGSALTYARRYSITAVLNLVADEDDDGNSASRRQPTQQRPEPVAQSANGDAQLATKADVLEMVKAAEGLEPEQIRLCLAATGIPNVDNYGKVPADKVVALIQAFAEART